MVDFESLRQRSGAILAVVFVIAVLVIAVAPSGYLSTTDNGSTDGDTGGGAGGGTGTIGGGTGGGTSVAGIAVIAYHKPDNPIAGQKVTLYANATSNVPIKPVKLYVDGALVSAICNRYYLSQYKVYKADCVFGNTYNSPGTHTYYAVATDNYRRTARDPAIGTKSFVVSISKEVTGMLTVSKSPAAGGSVTSIPAGIECGTTCSATFNTGSSVTLSGTALPGYIFQGQWTGCTSQSGFKCLVTMSAAKTVAATFEQGYVLTAAKSGTGSGTISTADGKINCGAICSATFLPQQSIELTATAATGSTFTSWSGCAGVVGNKCTVGMNANKTATATFTANTVTYPTISVSHSPANPTVGQPVTLTATAASDVSLTYIIIAWDNYWLGTQKYCSVSGTTATCTQQLTFNTAGTHTYFANTTDASRRVARDPPQYDTKSFTVS